MKNKYWIALIVLAALVGCEKPIQPNVILIMTDDQGYGDLGCHGNPILKTPNLEDLSLNLDKKTNCRLLR